MKRFNVRFAILLVLLISILGCKKEEPNPEMLDPIYKDLKKLSEDHQKEYDVNIARRKELREELAKVDPNTLEQKDIQREIVKNERALLDNEQMSRFYRIKAERRKLVGRIAYKKAFHRGEEWPNPREYSDYLVSRRVLAINRNWNARVPKLQDRMMISQTAPAKGEKAQK